MRELIAPSDYEDVHERLDEFPLPEFLHGVAVELPKPYKEKLLSFIDQELKREGEEMYTFGVEECIEKIEEVQKEGIDPDHAISVAISRVKELIS